MVLVFSYLMTLGGADKKTVQLLFHPRAGSFAVILLMFERLRLCGKSDDTLSSLQH